MLLIFTDPESVVSSLITASTSAVTLSIKLLAIYAIWLGLIEIVEKTNLSKKISNLLSPVIDFLFGKMENKSKQFVSMNISFNLLGIGNAATPSAIYAINSMDKHTGKTTSAMLMLLVINATSLQLIPTTIIGMRVASGSLNSTDIIFPSLVASAFSTILGVIFLKFCFLFKNKKNRRRITKKRACNLVNFVNIFLNNNKAYLKHKIITKKCNILLIKNKPRLYLREVKCVY